MVHRIALIRHGESVWNLENIFTGWTDVDLSETGVKEAIQVGVVLMWRVLAWEHRRSHADCTRVTAGRQATEDRRLQV